MIGANGNGRGESPQFDFFEKPPPFVRTSDTSRAAAGRLAPLSAKTLRARVLRVIEAAGEAGRTDEELQDELQMAGSTQRPRRVELVEGGYIRDSGQRRPTHSGRAAVVWVACKRDIP